MEPINLGQNLSGSWDAGTFSNWRSGSYAKYFTFSLSEETTVVISLTSETDPLVYLFNGLDINDRPIVYNDDASNYSRNSQLITTLQAGTYTIEATTCNEGQEGSFELSLSVLNLPSESSIKIGQTISGTWNAEAPRSNWRSGSYARHYSFWLSEEDTITISLKSEIDTYLVLFKGTDTNDSPITNDDDGGDGRNSRLVQILQPGLYTIEATTCYEGQEGSFELNLSSRNSPIKIGETVSGTWDNSMSSNYLEENSIKYFIFSLAEETTVAILLKSERPASVSLLEGVEPRAYRINEQDCYGISYNPPLVQTLQPGRYTIEAKTRYPGLSDSFELSLTGMEN